ncbi:MAG: hypothetical protein C4319_05815 [Acidimicrobiia bacterium]
MAAEKTPIQAYLGEDFEQIPDTSDARVLVGNGYVVKLASPALTERERRVLELAIQGFPVRVPRLVEGGISWVIMKEIPHAVEEWSDADLEQALTELAALHEAFLGSEILEQPWLRDPLDRDLEMLLAEARTPSSILDSELQELVRDPSEIVEFLRAQPKTLLHGDPFPRNVLRARSNVDIDSVATSGSNSHLVWIDWCHASVGPPAGDLASWLDQTPWAVDRPIDRLTHINTYLSAWKNPPDRDAFLKSLDASRVLWFFAYDLPRLRDLADSKPEIVTKINEEALRAYEAFRRG